MDIKPTSFTENVYNNKKGGRSPQHYSPTANQPPPTARKPHDGSQDGHSTHTSTVTPKPTASAAEAQEPEPNPQKQDDDDAEGTNPAGQARPGTTTSTAPGQAANAKTSATDRDTNAAGRRDAARNTSAETDSRTTTSTPRAQPTNTREPTAAGRTDNNGSSPAPAP